MVKVTRAIPMTAAKIVLADGFMTASFLVPNSRDLQILITVVAGEKGSTEFAEALTLAAGSRPASTAREGAGLRDQSNVGRAPATEWKVSVPGL
jgi:hypothetical protein